MERLDCPIRPYPWGSREAIARIQGRPVPSPGPEAELWAGAHPAAPSHVAGRPLSERIAADPVVALGPESVERFGPRLPYLLKLVAAAQPLSLQAHPDPDQAAAGYAAEEAAGVPADAAQRRYVDPYHKPELLVAVSEFRALCGFRDPSDSARLLEGLGVPALDPAVRALAGGDLAGATRWLLARGGPGALAAEVAAEMVAEVVAAAGREPGYDLVGELADRHPDDPGVVVALLLNQVTLAPGEAIFMPAGNLHVYLSGIGVEVMAASDNVLRGGLTGKYVDVAELLRVLRCEPLRDPVLAPVPVAPGVVTWPVPVSEFALHRVRLDPAGSPVTLAVPGAAVALCLAGRVRVDDGVVPVTVGAGEVAFAAGARSGPLTLAGAGAGEAGGEVYLASVG